MILFCGDMSVPNKECYERLSKNMDGTDLFKNQTVIINLEGVLLDGSLVDSFWKVYNDLSVINLKEHCKQLIFCLANNHTYDYPKQIKPMLDLLRQSGIKYFGIIENGEILPLEFEDDGCKYAIFGHCWEVYTKTNTNTMTDDRVVDCSYETFYKIINE